MNSATVSLEIRQIIRPKLREVGFNYFTSRTAWRHGDNKIDVINFQSLNSYHAERTGLTSYSFAVNLGCYLTYVPDDKGVDVPQKDGLLLPPEYWCPFRRRLNRSIDQPGTESREFWYIDEEGYYLESAIHDVSVQAAKEALPWFDRFSSPGSVLHILLEEDESNGTWGMGAKPSPHRNYLTGYTAIAAGNRELGLKLLISAYEWYRQLFSDRDPFAHIIQRLSADIQDLQRA